MAINELWVPGKLDSVHHTPTDPTELVVLSQLIVLSRWVDPFPGRRSNDHKQGFLMLEPQP